jgi:transposase
MVDLAFRAVVTEEPHPNVIAALGMHRSNIYRWLAEYREGGLEALDRRKAPGKPPKLNGQQLEKLYSIITSNNPLQLNFEFALWTREMIRELIREQFHVRLSAISVGRLLHKLGLSPQKPLYHAYQRDEEKRRVWTEELYPEIRKLARKEGATIFFGDEASVRSDHHRGRTWAPVGQTPVIQQTGARFSVNMVSAVSPRGDFRFMTFQGSMNAERFIEFLKRMMHNVKEKIFLVLDGHPVHKSKRVKEFVESTDGKLRIFILPPYSPDLNPDEWVWNWLKTHCIGRSAITGPDQFRALVKRYLHQLQQLPNILRGFFLDSKLAYI